MLTTEDLRRPAIKRIAHSITVLSTPVWLVPVLLAMLCGAIAFVFGLIAGCAHWLMRQWLRPLEELKWIAAEAFVKRWPTPKAKGAYHCGKHGGYGFMSDCIVCQGEG